MTAPAVQDADAKTGTGAGATSYTLTYPTNLVAGDLILIRAAFGGTVTPSATGFTVIINTSSAVVMARTSDGTETGTFTLSIGGTARNAAWRVDRVTGWYGGTLNAGTTSNTSDGIEATTSVQTSTTTPDPPAVTPAWGSADDLILLMVSGGQSGIVVSAYPANYTNGASDTTNTLFATARRSITGTTENPGTFTLDTATNATTGRTTTVALRPATAVTLAETGSGADALALGNIAVSTLDDTGTGTDAIGLSVTPPSSDDSGSGADALSVAISTAITGLDDTGAGADALAVSVQTAVSGLDDTGDGTDFLSVEVFTDLTSGKLWIGRFINTDPQYTISDEIITHEQVDEGQERANIISVDGQEDSWTEYDRGDLVDRDIPINAYFDLPELKSVGDVRQRTVEELDTAKGSNSPGGVVVWRPAYTRLDHIFWIAEDGSKYETRIEGIDVEFDQSTQPFQWATIDTGLMVFCPPDEAASYLVRDLFERESTDGIGTADIGGAWTTS